MTVVVTMVINEKNHLFNDVLQKKMKIAGEIWYIINVAFYLAVEAQFM